jgi:hypothetical protein
LTHIRWRNVADEAAAKEKSPEQASRKRRASVPETGCSAKPEAAKPEADEAPGKDPEPTDDPDQLQKRKRRVSAEPSTSAAAAVASAAEKAPSTLTVTPVVTSSSTTASKVRSHDERAKLTEMYVTIKRTINQLIHLCESSLRCDETTEASTAAMAATSSAAAIATAQAAANASTAANASSASTASTAAATRPEDSSSCQKSEKDETKTELPEKSGADKS